ncbi:helix-turn-helix domain-containing protein [Bacteroidota bacterium]
MSSLYQVRKNSERDYITKILITQDWNISTATTYLQIERTNLYGKMKQPGIEKVEI